MAAWRIAPHDGIFSTPAEPRPCRALSTARTQHGRRKGTTQNSGQLLQLAASDSLCLPPVRREEKVHAAIVDVSRVLKKRVDHVPDGGCSIWSKGRKHDGRRRTLAVFNLADLDLQLKPVRSSQIWYSYYTVVTWVS